MACSTYLLHFTLTREVAGGLGKRDYLIRVGSLASECHRVLIVLPLQPAAEM